MKQLLSMSKEKKLKAIKTDPKTILTQQLQSQQQNFIYEDDDMLEQAADEPTQQQIVSGAGILGIRLPEEEDLLYIVREYLLQPTPTEYHTLRDDRGEYYYRHSRTGEVTYEHPCDEVYRQRVIQERKNKIKNIKKTMSKINLPKSKAAFVDGLRHLSGQPEAKRSSQDSFLYDDEPKPSHMNSRNSSQNSNKPVDALKHLTEDIEVTVKSAAKKTAPAQRQNQPRNKEAQSVAVERRAGNPQLLQARKLQIQQSLHNKYQKLHQALQFEYISALQSHSTSQKQLKQAPVSEVPELTSRLARRKKQLETQLMLQHAGALDKLRIEADRRSRDEITMLNSKYNIEGLYAEMAQCRKVLARGAGGQSHAYMQEMDGNVRGVGELEVGALVAQIERECRAELHGLISAAVTGSSDWQACEQVKQLCQSKIHCIFSKYEQALPNAPTTARPQQHQPEEPDQLYSQLQSLHQQLQPQAQEDSLTGRSNLSARQTRLVDLLHNRVTQPA